MPARTVQRTPQSRVWLIEDGAGPANVPSYEGFGRAGGVSWDLGSVDPIYLPSDERYGDFDVIGEIRGQRGLPELPLQFRMTEALSEILRIVRKGCAVDVQVHIGACEEPTDFNGGWSKILVLEHAIPTNYGTDDIGTFDQAGDAVVNEDVPFMGRDYYEIGEILPSEVAGDEVTDEIIAVVICDSKTCGACGISSDGCEVAFAIGGGVTGSPGLPSEVLYTQDKGSTWAETSIASLGLANAATDAACVGVNLAVISNAGEGIHYAPVADILDAVEVWTEMLTGFVAAGSPFAIFAVDAQNVWIVGEGGYVYYSADITASVTAQTEGTVTTEDLHDVHFWDRDNGVAVGDTNAVIFTDNGGDSWASVTGPAVGINLNTVWMKSDLEWFVGDAGGNLWYTRNGGTSWTQKAFPGDGAGSVRDISFSTSVVGYMAHSTAAVAGRVLRTIDGGNSWYVLPESSGAIMPANDYVGALASCKEDPNLVIGGGLADDATDGFLVKFA